MVSQEYEEYANELARMWLEGNIDFVTAVELLHKKRKEIEERQEEKVKTVYV